MRVTGGLFRSRELKAPRGIQTRPTSDRVREALFSILTARGVFDEPSRVLDLYAGTGALALEALSRGAARATLVERERPALAAIAANVASLGVSDRVVVLGCAVEKAPASFEADASFDLIFADPPYADVPTGVVARALAKYASFFARYAVVVLEHSAGDPAPELAGLTLASTRRYGDSSITLYDCCKDVSQPVKTLYTGPP